MNPWHDKRITQLSYKYNPAGHPLFPINDWQYEVSNNDTRLGYWEWLLGRITSELEPDSLFRELLAYAADAFNGGYEVNGADLVEWFAEFRIKVNQSQEDYV